LTYLNKDGNIYTSARDDGTGKPITDVNIKSSDSIPLKMNVLSSASLAAGSSYTSAWVDVQALKIAMVGLNYSSDQPLEISLQYSDTQASYSRAFQGTMPPSSAVGATYNYSTGNVPLMVPKAKYYRWVVTNLGSAATTNLRIEEKVASINLSDSSSVFMYPIYKKQIRDTASVPFNKSILEEFGANPKTIVIESTLNQAADITFYLSRSPEINVPIGTFNVPSGTREFVLTYADFPVLASPITLLYGIVVCSVAPTAGEITIGLVASK
jgi:hypothetical protein